MVLIAVEIAAEIADDGAYCRSAWSECAATCSGNSTVTRTRSATAVCTAVLIQQQEQTCGASECNAAVTGTPVYRAE